MKSKSNNTEKKRKKENANKKKMGLRNRVPRIVYLALLIASAVLVTNRGGGFSYVLFFSVVLYIPIAFIQLLYTRKVLRIYQDVNGRLLYKNTAVPCQITIENSGMFPIGSINLIMDKKITEFESDFTEETYSFLPGENREIDTKISCKYAGEYVEGISRIKIADMFGLMSMEYDIPSPLRIHVLPVITDIAVAKINRLFEEIAGRRQLFKLDKDDIAPGNELRKYAEGDPLNTVHWKNYARTGEVYVRIPDKQESEMLTVVIIPDRDTTIEKHDYMLEYIVSIANLFARQSKPVNFIYYSGGVKTYLIEGYDSFRVFYMEKLTEFGAIGKEIPSDAEDKLIAAAAKAEGAVAYYYEENGLKSYVDQKESYN